MKRNRSSGVEDRWNKTNRGNGGNARTVPSARLNHRIEQAAAQLWGGDA